MRVVTWNARGTGNSGGGNEWSDLGVWMGEAAVNDYTRLLNESMSAFAAEHPGAHDRELFICGYSAGATFAAAVRPPAGLPQFRPARYILVSYPVEAAPCIGIFMTGGYFRALEALVQGGGWEGYPHPEPPVRGVLTLTGGSERGPFYGMWTGILGSKNSRGVLTQVVVNWANHVWADKLHCIPEEVDKWLQAE
ncbi:hypothetical protein HDZ31DRAFT_84915 [Schizophyllum fasciatum]